ncbi:MAG: ABC transporter permease [Candidatus Bathyarchaeota archaeon]|nr:ABC transporter permease [Candidatus Bathyarchaeota archaeon]
MTHKSILALMRWELKEYFSFPVFEIVLFIAVFSILNTSSILPVYAERYSNLHWGIQNIFFYLTISICAVFSRSFAGAFSKNEIKTLLSYPIKRSSLFFAKYLTMFLTLLIIYASVWASQLYIQALSPLEPMFWVSLLAIIPEILLLSTITVAIALVVKNEVVSIFASVLLLYGLANLESGGISLLIATGRYKALFGYFSILTHGRLPIGMMYVHPPEDVVIAFLAPLLISIILLAMSIAYFKRMQID